MDFRTFILCSLPLAFLSLAQPRLYAQDTYSSDFRARVSAGVDWKVARGLHATLDEQLRLENGMSTLAKSVTTAGLDWKFCPWVKVGGDFSYIYKKDDVRRRYDLYVTGLCKPGRWTLSLREKLLLTHKTKEFNEYQKPRNAVELKSRVKASYTLYPLPLDPYASVEFRHILNASHYSSLAASSMTYTDRYLNRVRYVLGCGWKIDKHNVMDFYAMYDYGQRKVIDANKAGALKSISRDLSDNFTIGVAWQFRIK